MVSESVGTCEKTGAKQHICNVKCLVFADSNSSLFKIGENGFHLHVLLWTEENNGASNKNYFWLTSRIVWKWCKQSCCMK